MPTRLVYTNYGLRTFGRKHGLGTTVTLAECAVGQGANQSIGGSQTELVDEVARVAINRIYPDPSLPAGVFVEIVLPVTRLNVTIREIGVYDNTGNLFAIAETTPILKRADDRITFTLPLVMPYAGQIELQPVPVSQPRVLEWPQGTVEGREFLPNTLAIMHNGKPDFYEIVTVESVTDSKITLTADPTVTWPAGARIVPLRRARLDSLPEIANLTNRAGQTTARFEILDVQSYSPEEDWGYCAPVFRFPVDWSESVTVNHDRNVYTFQSEMGERQIIDPGQRDRVMTKVGMKMFGREIVLSLRRFISAARGKTVRFWAPSSTSDLQPLGAISGDHFDCRDIGFTEAFRKPQDSKIMVAFIFNDGRPTIYRRLTAVAKVVGGERFFVNIPLPPIPAGSLESVQFMLPSRFDQDAFEFRHHVDGSAAVSTSLVFKSAETDGMPDIDCYVTSKPYPVDAVESLSAAMAITGAALQEVELPLDELDAGMLVTGGSLRDPLTVLTLEPDALDAGMSVTNGELRSTYQSLSASPEALNAGAAVTGGEFRNILVSYTDGPVGMDVGMVVTGGSLV